MGELRQLVWNDVKLDHEKPHIIARAATTKNRRQAIIPLHPELIPLLQASKGPAKPADSVFGFTCCHHAVSSRRFIEDLERAGIRRIDDMGRKLDFHCLRYTSRRSWPAWEFPAHGAGTFTAFRPPTDRKYFIPM
jgi:integrase